MRKLKNNQKSLNEVWSNMIQQTTGITDPDKVQILNEIARNTILADRAKRQTGAYFASSAFGTALNESFGVPANGNAGVPGGAYYNSTPGTVGGVYAPYQNLYNTVGIGDPRTPGNPALTGADYADNTQLGSGDKWPLLLPMALKVAAKTIGFNIVNTIPLQGPTGVLPYMDYIYSGTKQPYGSTPGFDSESENPNHFHDMDDPHKLYGLPAAFKASFNSIGDYDSVGAFKAAAIRSGLKPGDTVIAINQGKDLKAEFIGWGRMDGDPMFKVLGGSADLASLFEAAGSDGISAFTVPSKGDPDKNVNAKIVSPRPISMLEDQIQGYTGAGTNDRDPWYGTYQNGMALYEPMSRATGEMSYARQLSTQFFTKSIAVGTIMVSVAVTQEQVSDTQKQWGIDVLKMIENAGIEELSSTINRHILSRVFALGWKNHCKMAETEGASANLNITFAEDATKAGIFKNGMTPAFAIPEADATQTGLDGTYKKWTNVAMAYRPLYLNSKARFENQATLLQRLQMKFIEASNWIQQRGRHGQANFAVTNITVAAALQSNAGNSWAPIPNNVAQKGGQLYPLGNVAGIPVYVDPLMAANDTRVLIGRKGEKNEPGTVFCPYLMAESVKMISEGTAAPKVVLKSRYALVDVGFYPETQYVTFHVDFAGMF